MLERLTKIINEYTGKNNIPIDENTVLISDLEVSSFDLVNLVVSVEDEFNIEIPDKCIKDFKTVGDVIKFIENQ